jgi:hypothetical protein
MALMSRMGENSNRMHMGQEENMFGTEALEKAATTAAMKQTSIQQLSPPEPSQMFEAYLAPTAEPKTAHPCRVLREHFQQSY